MRSLAADHRCVAVVEVISADVDERVRPALGRGAGVSGAPATLGERPEGGPDDVATLPVELAVDAHHAPERLGDMQPPPVVALCRLGLELLR